MKISTVFSRNKQRKKKTQTAEEFKKLQDEFEKTQREWKAKEQETQKKYEDELKKARDVSRKEVEQGQGIFQTLWNSYLPGFMKSS